MQGIHAVDLFGCLVMVWAIICKIIQLAIVCWLVGQPAGFVYGVGPIQHGFGPQPPGLRQQFQFIGRSAPTAGRPVSAMAPPPRPGPETAAIQRPPITEQSAAAQPGMQFVPTQVILQ